VRWILDDTPFEHLARLENLDFLSSCLADELLICSTTAADAAQDGSGRRQALLARTRPDGVPIITVVRVVLGSDDPAAEVFSQLGPDETATVDLAEHESIAWAAVHGADAVLVTGDRRATVTALAELGLGRVAHPSDLWLHLRARRGLSRVDFIALCEATRGADQGLRRMAGRVAQFFAEPG